MKRLRRPIDLIGAGLLLIGLLLTACSGTAGAPISQPTATTAIPDPSRPAVGQPVRVAFVNRQLGLLSYEGAIRRTTDGGRTWVTVHNTSTPVRQLEWVGEVTAFALTGTNIVRSQDAGIHWEITGNAGTMVRIDFLDRRAGYAVSGNRLLATTDGGMTFVNVDTGASVQAVQFLTPERGWVAAPDGIATTSDGGRSWQRQATFGSIHAAFGSFVPGEDRRFADPAWVSIRFTDVLHGFVLYAVPTTLMSQRPSFLFYTSDGGQHWRLQSDEGYFPRPSPFPTPTGGMPVWVVGDLVATGPTSALILDYRPITPSQPTLAITTDSGISWRESPLPDGSGAFLGDGQIAAIGSQVWVVWLDWSRSGAAGGPVRLVTTTDLGQNWTVLHPLDGP